MRKVVDAVVWLVGWCVWGTLAPLLLFFGRTWRSRTVGGIAAISSIAASLLGLGSTINPYSHTAEFFMVALLLLSCGVVVIALAVLLLWSVPKPIACTQGWSFTGPPQGWWMRLGTAFLDERDWLWLGVHLGTRLDFRLAKHRRVEIRDAVVAQLEAMRGSGLYHRCPSPWVGMLWCWPWHIRTQPCLVFTPPQRTGAALIFLHGHGGNTLFQAYLWREFAIRYGVVVACPSYGYGQWEHRASATVVAECVRYLADDHGLARYRMTLCGLSQGGAGVGVAAAAMPDVFDSLVFLSPTMEPAVLASPGFRRVESRVLVLHGAADRHVTLQSVQHGLAALERCGADVTAHLEPDADHGWFLTHTQAVQGKIAQFMKLERVESSHPPEFNLP